MILKVFLLFLLNHIIFDFIFQGKSIIKKRFPKELYLKVTIKGNIMHSMLHLLGMVIIIIFIKECISFKLNLFIKVVLIATVHFFIDEIKSVIILYKSKYRNNILLFIMDQLNHVLVIILIILQFNNSFNIYEYSLDNYEKVLIALIVFLIITIVTGIFIKIFIAHLMTENIDLMYDGITFNGGFIIGILERILIFIGVFIDYYAIAGLILTTKSIARFNKLSEQRFAEYFIIGNLISFTSAILGGVLVKFIINI